MEDKTIYKDKVYKVPDVAELLDIHPETVKELCRSGELQCRKIGEWKILGQALINFMMTDHPTPVHQGLLNADGSTYTGGVPTVEEAKQSQVDNSAMGVPSLTSKKK